KAVNVFFVIISSDYETQPVFKRHSGIAQLLAELVGIFHDVIVGIDRRTAPTGEIIKHIEFRSAKGRNGCERSHTHIPVDRSGDTPDVGIVPARLILESLAKITDGLGHEGY